MGRRPVFTVLGLPGLSRGKYIQIPKEGFLQGCGMSWLGPLSGRSLCLHNHRSSSEGESLRTWLHLQAGTPEAQLPVFFLKSGAALLTTPGRLLRWPLAWFVSYAPLSPAPPAVSREELSSLSLGSACLTGLGSLAVHVRSWLEPRRPPHPPQHQPEGSGLARAELPAGPPTSFPLTSRAGVATSAGGGSVSAVLPLYHRPFIAEFVYLAFDGLGVFHQQPDGENAHLK